MSEQMAGGCACGRVRFVASIEDDKAYLCHCRMCQRATGNISVAYKNLDKSAVEWLSDADWYASSPIAHRPYCRECGTSLGFAFPDGDKMDLTIASFDDPSRFRPTHHFGVESLHRHWINTDGLPKYRTEDYKPLADRWISATGKLPD
jgi:hypothetical protein